MWTRPQFPVRPQFTVALLKMWTWPEFRFSRTMTRALALTACAALTCVLSQAASAQTAPSATAQTYPAKPVRVIVPFPAGGGADIFGRLMGRKLQDGLGQPFVTDNRAGASGIIGCETV